MIYDRRLIGKLYRPDDMPDHADEVANIDQDAFDLQLLHKVINQLSPVYQDVIQWCVLEGLAPAAVAIATSTPAGTIRSRLTRALHRARQAYAAALAVKHVSVSDTEPRHD